MFIKTIEPEDAQGEIAELYNAEIEQSGFVMDATKCWSALPDIAIPVETLLSQIRDNFSLGLLNFRLITLVTAKYVPSSYCSHVYFKALSGIIGRDQALAVQHDYRSAGLSEQQVEMLVYAEQITRDASRITAVDIARLRDVGLTDLNIADIALAASFRNFLSRYFDAVGAEPEAVFLDGDEEVRSRMAVGKKYI